MKLKALDQVHISAVKASSLRPGEEFEVSDDIGTQLLKARPTLFTVVEDGAMAEPEPDNKAESAAPSNKAINRRKTKSQAD